MNGEQWTNGPQSSEKVIFREFKKKKKKLNFTEAVEYVFKAQDLNMLPYFFQNKFGDKSLRILFFVAKCREQFPLKGNPSFGF